MNNLNVIAPSTLQLNLLNQPTPYTVFILG